MKLIPILLLSLFLIGCDTPAENAQEERIEDSQDAAGVDEDVAEERGEAVSEGTATDTTGTTGTTATSATTATTTTYP